MRQLALIAGIVITAAGSADARPARTLQDLVGARGSSGEMQLTQRGFVAGKSNLAQGGRVVFWGNASDGTCVKVLTKDGRYAWIKDAPPSSCGLRRGAAAAMPAKVNVNDVMGKSGVDTFDIMRARGFEGVDTLNSGNDLVAIYWNGTTKQCIQVITSKGLVVAVSDIQTHPKCK